MKKHILHSTLAIFGASIALGSLTIAPLAANKSDFVSAVQGDLAIREGVDENLNPKDTSPVTAQANTQVFVIEQGLPEFLRQAARRNGYEITLSSKVRGTLRKMQLPLDIEAILQRLAPQFDLKWHYQDKQVFVSLGSENTTRLIFLGAMKFDELEEAVSAAGISTRDFKLSYVEKSNSVLVNGPVTYIGSIELLADSFNKQKKENTGKVKVIRFGTVGK